MITGMLARSHESAITRPEPNLVRPTDAQILTAALARLGGRVVDFELAIAALHETVVAMIPAGRVYLLGHGRHGPIVGSLITGIGLSAAAQGVSLVHVRGDRVRVLGRFGSVG